ncbi:unnamed protein product [Peronospora belbahrii]|uniref:Uncharacterized protein n=1 Tax=Peronospora belbahrii TaxID=622444 RepID=A0AAU9KL70_9STRA|nr:unnamed protein product [Peronospora belbahrii]
MTLFWASLQRFNDVHSSDVDRRFAALAPLPTPVEPELCTRIWIPASRLTAEHNIHEILESLAADSQPSRLPANVTDLAVYDWFVARGARPVLITPTQVFGELNLRSRTVYFHSVACPSSLFEPNSDPLREIHFLEGKSHVFSTSASTVQPRSAAFPPAPVRPSSPRSDATMGSDDGATTSDELPSTANSVPSVSLPTSSPSPAMSVVRAVPPPAVPSGSTKHRLLILGSVATDEPMWKLVQHSQYGIIRRDGPKYLEPPRAVPCRLYEGSDDPHSLLYSIPVMPTMYDVLYDDGYDTILPPDVDINPSERDKFTDLTKQVSGFSEDSDLVPAPKAIRSLMNTRKLPLRVEQVSVRELEHFIDEYLASEFSSLTSHDDAFAAVQVQPAYFRRLFKLPVEHQTRLFKRHAAYRSVSAEPLQPGEVWTAATRLSQGFTVDPMDVAGTFDSLFHTDERNLAALSSVTCDFFLMIFAPAIYVDPVKVATLLPGHAIHKRIRHSPFPLWSDIILLYLARTDVGGLFLSNPRTPSHVVDAIRYLANAALSQSAATGCSSLVRPRI